MLTESAANGDRLCSSSHEMPGTHRGNFPSSSELLGRESLNGLGCSSSPGKEAIAFLLFKQNIDFNSVENVGEKEAG